MCVLLLWILLRVSSEDRLFRILEPQLRCQLDKEPLEELSMSLESQLMSVVQLILPNLFQSIEMLHLSKSKVLEKICLLLVSNTKKTYLL